MFAPVAGFHMTAQRRRATPDHGAERLSLDGVGAVLRKERVTVRAKHLGRLRPRVGHASEVGSVAEAFSVVDDPWWATSSSKGLLVLPISAFETCV